MTHVLKLLYGSDKRNPDRELSLSDIDTNIYIVRQDNPIHPGAGELVPLFSGRSTRYDGQRKLNESRDNTKLDIKYSISAQNTQHLQIIQRKINRFFLECSPGSDKRKKVWLEYRWSVNGLDNLPRPTLGQLNHYLEVLHADVKQWPNALHSGQMVAGYVEGVSLEITGKPYWEGLEDRAADADGLAETTDSTIKYTLNSSEVTADFTIATWIEHRASDYVVFEYYVDASNYVRLEWDQSDGRFEIVQNDAGTPTTTNGGAQTLSAGTKYHLAVIQDDTGNTIKSYLSGVADVSGTDQTMSNGGALYFGSAASVTTIANTTGLDARRVWSTNITAAQLLALYTAEQAIITAGETIQYPLYFKTTGFNGVIANTSLPLSSFYDAAVAYWEMEESGTNDRVDSSTNGNDLTATASIANAIGVFGNGVDFESGDTAYLTIANASAGDLKFGDTDFSVALWIKPETMAFSGLIGFNQSGATKGWMVTMSSGGGIGWAIGASGGTFTPTNVITANAWSLVIMVHDSVNNKVHIYINDETEFFNFSGGPSATPSGDFVIGHDNPGTPNYFDGVMDEIIVLDYALSATEVLAIYNYGYEQHGILYGLPGDSLSKIRIEANLPTAATVDRVGWVGLLPSDSSYTPTDVHIIDFNATGSDYTLYVGGGYTAASVTSGSGTDTATIETTITTPGDLQPGRYRVLAHLRIVGGSATTATVTPYYRIGEATSPESYGTDNSVATNAGFLWQDLGDLNIGWPMDTLVKMTVGLKFAETAAVTLTPAIDFIMLMPAAAVKATCEDGTITIANGDTLHIDEKSAWVTDNSNSDSQLYHFHHEGNPLRAMPYKYNYLFFINGEDNQTFTIGNSSTVRVFVTPRWALPGGLVA